LDFSLEQYNNLLRALSDQGFSYREINTYLGHINTNFSVILRQDVDKKTENSLEIARTQNSLGIKSIFYFRVVSQSWDEEVIRKIVELGHEIGYHYEDLSFAAAKLKAQGKGQRATLRRAFDPSTSSGQVAQGNYNPQWPELYPLYA